MAYQMTQTPVTLNDLEGHSSVSELLNASRLHLCDTLQDFNWHARVARPLSDRWASCTVPDDAKVFYADILAAAVVGSKDDDIEVDTYDDHETFL